LFSVNPAVCRVYLNSREYCENSKERGSINGPIGLRPTLQM